MKAFHGGVWEDLVTTDVVFENRKEYRFVQAQLRQFTTVLLMSRFKRDYLIIPHLKRVLKLTSSYDQRVTLTFKKDTFEDKQKLVLKVQPVESSYVSEFRRVVPRGKRLLCCSHILHMDWDNAEFKEAVRIALPCPPNPAKASKMAQARKQKEEKQNVPKSVLSPDDLTKTAAKKPAIHAAAASTRDAGPGGSQGGGDDLNAVKNKWYMGQYALNDDDENDQLSLMTCCGGKWTYASNITVKQSKIDIVTFELDVACDRLLVLRTVTDVDEDSLKNMTSLILDQLSCRSVYIFVRQSLQYPYLVCCHVVPAWSLERTEKMLKTEGYTGGNEAPAYASLQEGVGLTLKLLGNLKVEDLNQACMELIYNSNIPTTTSFRVTEVDKYLERNFETFRGALQFQKDACLTQSFVTPKSARRANPSEAPSQIAKSDVICIFYIDIPKDHLQTDPTPTRAPLAVRPSIHLAMETLQSLAEDLGDEWQDLALKLHLGKVRVQAILRLITEGSEEHVKYEMLLSWYKRCPQAADKVSILSAALQAVGRRDLAQQLRFKK